MREVVLTPSFDQEIEEIGAYIEELFGAEARRIFILRLIDACMAIATSPEIGLDDHEYSTPLLGVVFQVNWIFFEYDDREVRFLHIVDSRRDKTAFEFGTYGYE